MLLVSGIFKFSVNNLVEFVLILFLWTFAMQPMDTYFNNLSLVHTVFIISNNYSFIVYEFLSNDFFTGKENNTLVSTSIFA